MPPHRNPPTSPLTPGLLTKRGFVEALSEWQSPYPSTLAIICWVLSTSCTHPCDEKKAQGKFYHHEICSCHVMIMNATDVGRHKTGEPAHTQHNAGALFSAYMYLQVRTGGTGMCTCTCIPPGQCIGLGA